jgi:hypothetical protein
MTFNHPIELSVLRSRLEAEGIECNLLDEYTTEANPFYAHAIGGVKLQVRERDVPTAVEILKEGGYLKDEHLIQPDTLDKLDKATSRIPVLKNWRVELRLMVIITIIVLIFGGIYYFATLPSTFERLTKQTWCVDQVTYNGQDFKPKTVESIYIIRGGGDCQERMDINTSGSIRLPGFNAHSAKGKWALEDNVFQISHADTFGFVYNGFYDIDFLDHVLILSSSTTTLYCRQQNKIRISF